MAWRVKVLKPRDLFTCLLSRHLDGGCLELRLSMSPGYPRLITGIPVGKPAGMETRRSESPAITGLCKSGCLLWVLQVLATSTCETKIVNYLFILPIKIKTKGKEKKGGGGRGGGGHVVPLLLLLPLLLLQVLLLLSPFVPIHSHHSVAPVTLVCACSCSSALVCPHIRALAPPVICARSFGFHSYLPVLILRPFGPVRVCFALIQPPSAPF